MKIFISILSVLFGASFASADIDCSDASQSIKYESVGYNLGIPPRHGDILSQEKIFVDGTLLSHSTHYKGLNPQLGPVVAEFDYDTMLELENRSGGGGFTKVYSIKLSLKNRNYGAGGLIGNDTGTLPADIDSFVICQESMIFVP